MKYVYLEHVTVKKINRQYEIKCTGEKKYIFSSFA